MMVFAIRIERVRHGGSRPVTPMRANIIGPPDSATRIRLSIAACHSQLAAPRQRARFLERARDPSTDTGDAAPAQAVKNSLTVVRHDSDHDRKESSSKGSAMPNLEEG